MTCHPTRRPGVLFGSGRGRQPECRGPRTGHHDARGQQAPRADGGAPGRGAAQSHDAADEPHGRRRDVPRAGARDPGRDRRHGTDAGPVEVDAQRPAAGQRDTGVRAQPHRAGHFPIRAQVPAGGRQAAAVGGPAAADGGRLRCLHPLRPAAGCAHHCAPHRAQPPPVVRVAGLPRPHGEPKVPADLARHNFISIRQGEEAYGLLRLARGRGAHAGRR